LKNLVQAMVTAASAMPVLAKTDTNQYGGYAYVPIDRYYALVAPVLFANGLAFSIGEFDKPDLVGSGKGATAVFHYECVLLHVSGESLRSRVSIPHPWQGAQTSGSAMSYAAKCFLRSTFALVTGEQDADATDPRLEAQEKAPRQRSPAEVVGASVPQPQAGPASPPAGSPPPAGGALSGPLPELTQGELNPILDHYFDGNLPILIDPGNDAQFPWTLARDVFHSFAPLIEEYPRFAEWCRLNIRVIEGMKQADPDSYAQVKRIFEERRKALLGKKG
jgi:hypothetical protein